MTLVRVNPWRTASHFNSLVDKFFNDSFLKDNGYMGKPESQNFWNPVVDVYDNEASIILKADLPGMKKEDIIIDVEGNVLTLKGERSSDTETKETNFYRRERAHGTFKRMFTLPEDVTAENINAELKDGVLKIEITKPEEKKPRQITVN